MRDLKSPASIRDQGLFCACQAWKVTVLLASFEGPGGRKDYSSLIPSQLRVLCRGKEFFCKFWKGSTRRLKRFLARLHVFRAE